MKNLLIVLLLFVISQQFAQDDNYGTGLLFDETMYEEVPQSVPLVTRSFNSLPSSFSLKGYAPTPGNQGQQGSCVGWASAYGARTIANAVRNNWKYNTVKINQNTFSPAFVYNKIRVNDKCQGSYIEKAMLVMNNSGSAKLNDFPYDYRNCTRSASTYTQSKAQQHKILTYQKLARWDNPINLVSKVKKAISQKNPVVVGLFKYGSLKVDYNNVWVANPGTRGHAMVVVGYDDNKFGGAFEIMNSWGSNWANKGFLWIKYGDFNNYIKTAYVLVDKSNNNYNNNNTTTYASNKLGGEIQLRLSNNSNMPVILSSGATRNFNIVKASKTTYKVNNTYSSGTQFRIYLKSKQRGYVYLIGYGSADKSVNKLYPFGNFSDYFNYSNSEIAIPNEDYFIEFDNNPGRDILCVLYSKEKLNINDIINKAKYGNGDFVSRIKSAIQHKMFKGNEVRFQNNGIAFNANSSNNTAKIVPVFIEMNHQ